MRPTAAEHPRSRGRGGKGFRIIDRTGTSSRDLTRPLRKAAGFVALISLGLMAPALGASPMPEQLPGSGTSAAPAGSGLPGQPVAPAPAPVAAPATTPATQPADALRPGTHGSDVKALQRKLRLRGIKVPVDGNYGARTRAGVRILQRKLKMKATGVADAALLAKLGLKIRAVASDPAALSAPTPAVARYLKVFPVVGSYSYEDDFGAPRGQGPHQGNDIIGAMGMQLVSCVDGTISRLTREETGLGGIWIWIVDGQGNEYYYAHMSSISPELKAGSKVTAGQTVGQMGMTGDARGTVPHLHFEIRPNGGGSINPYTELRAVDTKKK
ncbi:MAG: M23 family metallopeptidase [Acidobacteria bacterium]|nr:M23 family metallopeptidase [Acidobacteriota bacterium]